MARRKRNFCTKTTKEGTQKISIVEGNIKVLKNIPHLDSFHDAYLLIEDRTISVHRLILAAGSQVFRKIFEESPDRRRITIKGIKFEQMKHIITWIYYGFSEVDMTENEEFKEIANFFKIQGLWSEQDSQTSNDSLQSPNGDENEKVSENESNISKFDGSKRQLDGNRIDSTEHREDSTQNPPKRARLNQAAENYSVVGCQSTSATTLSHGKGESGRQKFRCRACRKEFRYRVGLNSHKCRVTSNMSMILRRRQ